jgi:activator of HSP90 ATPase
LTFYKKNGKYYIINKNIVDRFSLPINNVKEAKEYFELLTYSKDLPKLKTKLTKYDEVLEKKYYKSILLFDPDLSNCFKNEDKASSIELQDNLYKIERIIFNYEKKAFLLKINYEIDKN